MPKSLSPLLLVVAIAAVVGLARVEKAQARIESKCSAALIHDWYVDGRIDHTYQVHCYREALKSIPEDQIIYGTLREDLTRALQSAIRRHDGDVSGGTPVAPPGGGGGGPGDTSSGAANDKNEGFITRVARKLGPDTADSIPVPLLVLGGLALLLMAAAGVSFIARRVQAKRADTDPPPPRPFG
jgi:hypothetical protein